MTLPTINTEYVIILICNLISFVVAIVFHEVSHGFAAYKLGDPTAKLAGRLSLNPLRHIDIFGTVILPLVLMALGSPVFGYAKPVPYNPTYFKDPRKGDLIVGLSGPAANLVLALIGAGIAWLIALLCPSLIVKGTFMYYFYGYFLQIFTMVNLYLMMFNLLPIPPLDGSSIFAILIPRKYLYKYYQIQRYAMPILLILVFLVPYIFHINPISMYLNVTAGNLGALILPMI